MPNSTNAIKKVFIIVFVLFIVITFSVINEKVVLAKISTDNYIRLYNEVFQLEKEILANSVFQVDESDGKNFFIGGAKHIIKDQNGNKWLFKIDSLTVSATASEKISRFLRVCGFNTPILHTINLKINNQYYFGSIQKYIDVKKEIWSVAETLVLPQEEIENIFAQEIVTYLFALDDEFLWGVDEKLWFVDLNNVFYFPKGSAMPPEKEFMKISPITDKLSLGPYVYRAFELCHATLMQNFDIDICEKWTDLYPEQVIDGEEDLVSFFEVQKIEEDLVKERSRYAQEGAVTNKNFDIADIDTKQMKQSRIIAKELHHYFIRKHKNTLNVKTAKTINFIHNVSAQDMNLLLSDNMFSDSLIYQNYINSVLDRKNKVKKLFTSFYKAMPFLYEKDLLNSSYSASEIAQKTSDLQFYLADLTKELSFLKEQRLGPSGLKIVSSPEARSVYMVSKLANMIDSDFAVVLLTQLYNESTVKEEKEAIKNYIDMF